MKSWHEEVERSARHDSLTGLPNRLALDERLRQAIKDNESLGTSLAVCCLNLDAFKRVNDRFGRAAGDALLQEVASRLQACLRVNDTVARLGGDRFVVLLNHLHSIDECDVIVTRMTEYLAAPIVLDSGTAVVSTSVGVAICPQRGDSPAVLLAAADEAMYAAKKVSGRAQSRR